MIKIILKEINLNVGKSSLILMGVDRGLLSVRIEAAFRDDQWWR